MDGCATMVMHHESTASRSQAKRISRNRVGVDLKVNRSGNEEESVVSRAREGLGWFLATNKPSTAGSLEPIPSRQHDII